MFNNDVLVDNGKASFLRSLTFLSSWQKNKKRKENTLSAKEWTRGSPCTPWSEFLLGLSWHAGTVKLRPRHTNQSTPPHTINFYCRGTLFGHFSTIFGSKYRWKSDPPWFCLGKPSRILSLYVMWTESIVCNGKLWFPVYVSAWIHYKPRIHAQKRFLEEHHATTHDLLQT